AVWDASTVTIVFTEEEPAAGTRHELTADAIVGREGGDITLDDKTVSRRHAALRMTSDGATIEDLGSTHGTYVNGEKVTSKRARKRPLSRMRRITSVTGACPLAVVRTRTCARSPWTSIDWIAMRGRCTPRARAPSTAGQSCPPACCRVAEARSSSQMVVKSPF